MIHLTVGGAHKFPKHILTCGCFYLNFQFMKVFSSFKDVKVIQFSSMQDAFTGFKDKARPILSFCLSFPSVFASKVWRIHIHLPCPDAMYFCILIRKGKIDSENELNTTLVYGAVWLITLPVTYIMIYTGMRNLDGSQFLLKLLQMTIHLGEVNFRIICSSSKHL